MKHVISLTMILAIGSLTIAPKSAGAVDLIGQSIEIGGYSTTTIDNSPRTNTFYDNYNYPRNRRDRRQPTVIIQQNNIYPQNNRSNCTTTIIGSPIPSPIPLDRTTGQPCR